MTDTGFVESPLGNVFPADMKLTKDYWSDDQEDSPWRYVGSADMDGNLSWEFDLIAVFQHEDTKDILVAADSGCSCPQEFESHTVKDGTFVTSLIDFDIFAALHERRLDDWVYNNETEEYEQPEDPKRHPHVVDQISALRLKVEELLNV